ncbi:MAG: hypothetical protein Q8P04_01735, partial [bacterium]|nr:hypothetical protein [bacterium]
DDALELADTAGIKSINPFLRRRQRAVSDIVAVVPRGSVKNLSEKEAVASEEEGEKEKEGKKGEELPKKRKPEKPDKLESTPGRFVKAVAITAIVTAVFVALMIILPRAKINLNMEKKNLDFVGTMVTSAAVKENNFVKDKVMVRGATFSEKRNITKAYPANDKKYVERRAAGEIAIYNNFSSAPQTLVATTRFAAPDGRIYRLDNTVTVPGAESAEGKLTPSSIRAAVTADAPGEKYNLSPDVKLSIPGFEGSAKYNGFYAETKDSLSGGFVGETSLPSEEDVSLAKVDAEKSLEEVIKTQFLFNLPPEVKVLNNAYKFKITETKVNEAADEPGKFTVTVYGEAKLVGFREPELVDVIGKGLIGKSGNDFKVEKYELEYGDPALNADGSLNVPVKFKSVWTRVFDIDHFKREAAGKKRADLQALVFSIAGIQSGEARLWPFWVTRVPKNTDRIIVDVK